MTVARFEEDAYEDGGETLTVALDTTATRVCLSTDATDVWPPLYFTPQRAREIGQALLDAARAADGSTDPTSLFTEPDASDALKVAGECVALWRNLGHPMLLAAAKELEERLPVLKVQP